MNGSTLYRRVTARKQPLTGPELADPELEVDLWAAVLHKHGVAARLVEFLHMHPALLDLEVSAFARAITSVPGLEQGLAGQVVAVFALRGHVQRLVAGDSGVDGELEAIPAENEPVRSSRTPSSSSPNGLVPSENASRDAHDGENDGPGGSDGGPSQGAEPA